MYDFSLKNDIPLAKFVNDFIEDNLDKTERIVFREYLSTNNQLASFVRKSARGRQALRNAFRVKAADDFEEKLARRIAEEKRSNSSMNSAGMASAC